MPENDEKQSGFETLTAILIALVVIIGGIVAWRSSVAGDAAGDADYAGLRAVTNAEETRSINNVNAYESYGTYATYWRSSRLAALIAPDIANAPEEAQAGLEEQMKTANDIADATRSEFETRYLNRDGTYSVQRQLGEMWADAAKEKDMEYESQFKDADKLNNKNRRMLIAFLILTVAPVFFALIESAGGRLRYLLLALGSLTMVAGTVMAILVELGKI